MHFVRLANTLLTDSESVRNNHGNEVGRDRKGRERWEGKELWVKGGLIVPVKIALPIHHWPVTAVLFIWPGRP